MVKERSKQIMMNSLKKYRQHSEIGRFLSIYPFGSLLHPMCDHIVDFRLTIYDGNCF